MSGPRQTENPGDDKIDVVVYNRTLRSCAIEGMTALEVNACAKMVDERMRQIAAAQKIADSSKLAILTALEIAADFMKMEARLAELERDEDRKIDAMITSLQKPLEDS